ncbi:hypothetical protein J2S06_001848 [Bacillus alveayuensis]|uniref:Uncharacterized protein n=1 Tax=Aeribacillus alveayuensis TaxID=279215 RepID=A0ABT9VP64_9BACI|nr:hypothetical protein [Bacillus alveayuensis]
MNRMERIQRINEVEVAMIQKDENLLIMIDSASF